MNEEASTGESLAALRARMDELRETDRLKDELLATISHELRTPLANVIGFAALLRGAVEEDGDDEATWLDIILRNAHEMRDMVERILDFSRVQGGRVALHLDVHTLGEIVEEVLPLVASPLVDHRIVTQVEPGLTVLADPAALQRVLVNLLTNAAKFSDAGTLVRVHGRREGRWTRLDVEDQGRGIPGDQLAAIFDRFHQVAPRAEEPTRGAGVGLWIVESYLTAMGGEITVTSEVGVGSTFSVSIPSADR